MQYSLRKRAFKLSRKQLIGLISFIVLTFVGIAYAVVQIKMEINGKVSIMNSKWNPYFDNLVITEGSTKLEKEATISEDRKRITFTLTLKKPYDFYEFEVDMVNDGLIEAMVKDAKITGLPDSLKDYIECKLTYADDTEIKNNDLLKSGEKERIKASIEFKDIDLIDMPVDETFELILEIPYIQATDEAKPREQTKGKKLTLLGIDMIAYMDNESSEFVTSETGIDFTKYSSNTNGNGLYVYAGTENDTYPIYYYRGAVKNNNVIFADFCWKIVRTTSTGGTKLIYNGPIGDNGTCPGTNSQIGSSGYSRTYVGYKYIGYTYVDSSKTYDSPIKSTIESWYKTNISDAGYSSYIEDTIWCNEKNAYSEVNGIAGSDKVRYYGFGRRGYLDKSKPIVTCPVKTDSYTVSSLIGNGLLTYPIATITGDEAQLGGYAFSADNKDGNTYLYNTTAYLYSGQEYWTFSPYTVERRYYNGSYTDSTTTVAVVSSSGTFGSHRVDLYTGVRPSLSLKRGTKVKSGGLGVGRKGTAVNPYVIE